jgi:hypothetical protein
LTGRFHCEALPTIWQRELQDTGENRAHNWLMQSAQLDFAAEGAGFAGIMSQEVV